MKKRHKAYLKLNLISLFFIAVSLISISLAWFAYSGLVRVQTEIDVKTWYIEFQKNGEAVSNNIVISLADIYPGMETVHESVKILNKGDSNAQLSYEILSASILDELLLNTEITNTEMKDKISHDYPFSVNISLSKNFTRANNQDESIFDVSISWPLDSGNDSLDSEWGNRAYLFQKSEKEKFEADNSYNKKPSIKITISVKAEQYLEDGESSSDLKYPEGEIILLDVTTGKRCSSISSTCIRTHVIDLNNKVGDLEVTLLPDILNTYNFGSFDDYQSLLPNWEITTRELTMNDLITLISKDVIGSHIIREPLSNSIIGYVGSESRVSNIVNHTIENNGYFRFLNNEFPYLTSTRCFWVNAEYNNEKAFAFTKLDDGFSKIYGESKENNCGVIPVIVAAKADLE